MNEHQNKLDNSKYDKLINKKGCGNDPQSWIFLLFALLISGAILIFVFLLFVQDSCSHFVGG